MKNLCFALLCFSFLFACKTDPSKQVKVETPRDIYELPLWAQNANIYEVNVRQFTPEGTFKALEGHLPRLKKMNVDILWLMPMYQISKNKRKGSLGSPYAVTDYTKVNDEFGTDADFKNLIKKAHELDMYVILDFVPNHTGWDSDWITNHPEWFTQDDDGNVIDPIDPGTGESWGWTDVADLNYDNMEMRAEMIKDMSYWITEMDVDGFRMDVAHNVPQDFWNDASKSLLSLKPIFMLAEAEVPSHLNEKSFHSNYGWAFHHIINDVANGKKGVSEIKAGLAEYKNKHQHGFPIQFTSNHDENTWAGSVFDRMGDAHKAMAVLVSTINGMPLLYGGQEEPMRKRLKFFEKDDIGFKDYSYADFYSKLFRLKHENKALWNGQYGDQSPIFYGEDEEVLIFSREKDGHQVLVMINLSASDKKINSPIDITGTSLFSNAKVIQKEGSEVDLGPYAYLVISKT